MVLACTLLLGILGAMGGQAAAETRTLKLYFTHTKESATITYKRNGRYDQAGLRKLNRFLRDWRRKESTKMDPAVIDLLWEVYQKSGSRKPIHIVSAYRSPGTNNMLRKRGRGVAKNSQHTKGKAIDFFLPDVPPSKLRALGLRAHRGGVGYYKGSFVHLDTGRVRHWPRMSRSQLAKVFPRGRTIHIPSDGKPMKGQRIAMANLKKGLNADGSRRGSEVQPSLLARLFSRSGDDGDENESADTAPVPTAKPTSAPVAVAAATPAPATGEASIFELEAQRLAEAEARTPEILAALEPDRLATPSRRPGSEEPDSTATLTALAPDASEDLAARTAAAVLTGTDENVGAAIAAASVPAPDTIETSVEAATQVAAVAPQDEAIESRLELDAASQPDVSGLSAQVASTLDNDATRRAELEAKAERASQLAAAAQAALNASRTVEGDGSETVALVAPLTRTATPSWRADAAPKTEPAVLANAAPPANVEDMAVPVPAPLVAQNNVPFPVQLSLGDLNGSFLRQWAVVSSTRVGPIAKLRAPIYSRSTSLIAPTRVFSAGFEVESKPLRTDTFTGRSVTLANFARLASLN